MHRDIVDGRPSELHELIGAVVRLGRQAHVATPVSAELYAQLEPLERLARAGVTTTPAARTPGCYGAGGGRSSRCGGSAADAANAWACSLNIRA